MTTAPRAHPHAPATRRGVGGTLIADGPVTSLYLDLDGRGHRRSSDRQRSFAELVREARDRAEELGPAATRTVESHLDRIATWLDRSPAGTGVRSLAFFAGPSRDPLLHVFPLPRVVRDQVTVGPGADVRQLQAILADAANDTALVAGPKRSRVFGCRLGEVTEVADLTGPAHLAAAVDLVAERLDRSPDARLLLGGTDEEIDLVMRQLPASLRPPTRARLIVGVDDPAGRIETAVLAMVAELERGHEAATAAAVLGAVRTGGAVPGLEWSLAALSTGGAGLLLVGAGTRAPGARCPHCGMLTPVRHSCPRCGRTMTPLDDVVAEAVGEAPSRGCSVRVVADDESTDAVGGIAAVLRD